MVLLGGGDHPLVLGGVLGLLALLLDDFELVHEDLLVLEALLVYVVEALLLGGGGSTS